MRFNCNVIENQWQKSMNLNPNPRMCINSRSIYKVSLMLMLSMGSMETLCYNEVIYNRHIVK